MKLLRFRIAWVMVAVAIAALDFGLIRAILGPRTGNLHPETCILLVLGALPMANVLAVGMLVGQRRPASHPFLLGFEAFGMLALAFYISLAIFFSREVVMHYLEPLIALMEKIIGRDRPFVFFSILFFGSVVMLGCPQVAFALIGGSLSRRFRITITRR